MLNKILLLSSIVLILLTINFSSYCQKSASDFYLTGKVKGVKDGEIYLGYYINKLHKVVNDSSIIKNGEFRFIVNIYEPTVAFISLHRDPVIDDLNTNIFMEPSDMVLTLDKNNFRNPHMTGSITEKDFEELNETNYPLILRLTTIQNQLHDYSDPNDSIKISLKSILDSINRNDYEYFDHHRSSYLTAYLLQHHIRNLPQDSLILFYSRLSADLQNNIVTKNVVEKISKLKNGYVGSLAKPFTGKTSTDTYLMSFNFKGKYLLLDFWASWCVPCRKESNQLIQLYNKYHSKGLNIIGIAGDEQNPLAWKKAIEYDKTGAWSHILCGIDKESKIKGLNNPNDIADKYGIDLLPTLILINPDGIIIGRYTGEINKLDDRLKALLDK